MTFEHFDRFFDTLDVRFIIYYIFILYFAVLSHIFFIIIFWETYFFHINELNQTQFSYQVLRDFPWRAFYLLIDVAIN